MIEAAGQRDITRQINPPSMTKVEQGKPGWRAGYNAARAAKLAGKPTPPAPHGVNLLAYFSGAIEGRAAAGGRELDPKQVLTDLFEELHADDPEWLAERVIERLRDAGFVIWPGVDRPSEPRKPEGA